MAGNALAVREDVSKPVGAIDGLSVTDKQLLALARQRKSLEEISEELGGLLTPAEAGQRVREILRSHDWMNQIERMALVILDMEELKDILMSRIRSEEGFVTNKQGRSAYVHGDPRWSATLVNLLKEMTRLLQQNHGSLDAQKTMLRKAHAGLMMRAIDAAFRILAKELVARHPEIGDDEMADLLEKALPAAFAQVEAQTDES